jgi:hypothetical protein
MTAGSAMIISVINHTQGLLSDAEVQRAIRAVNRQIAEDFAPHWSLSATLRLEGQNPAIGGPIAQNALQNAVDMRGDAIIYLWHPMNVRIALGYHSRNFLGVPYGYVFPALSERIGEPWTVTFSHEALELVADEQVNLLVMGPHPLDRGTTVFHWYEVCDAVQQERYLVDGLPVSNFLLPLYFTNSEEFGSRNDFLGRSYGGRPLRSFGVNPGGYIGFFNPRSGEHELYFAEGDLVALNRLREKQNLGLTRRSQRYQALTKAGQSVTASIRQFLGGD